MIIQGVSQLAQGFNKAFIVFAMVVAPLTISTAQQNSTNQAPSIDGQRRPGEEAVEKMEAEMRAKRAIKEEEKQYRENLEREPVSGVVGELRAGERE